MFPTGSVYSVSQHRGPSISKKNIYIKKNIISIKKHIISIKKNIPGQRKEGRKEGQWRKEGRKEGRPVEEGRKEGRREGRKEGSKREDSCQWIFCIQQNGASTHIPAVHKGHVPRCTHVDYHMQTTALPVTTLLAWLLWAGRRCSPPPQSPPSRFFISAQACALSKCSTDV